MLHGTLCALCVWTGEGRYMQSEQARLLQTINEQQKQLLHHLAQTIGGDGGGLGAHCDGGTDGHRFCPPVTRARGDSQRLKEPAQAHGRPP